MSNWISVEEGLPREYVEVLVWPRNHGECIGFVRLLSKWYYQEYDSIDERFVNVPCTITHWQPLPEGPEE